jgi:hypothetical protein
MFPLSHRLKGDAGASASQQNVSNTAGVQKNAHDEYCRSMFILTFTDCRQNIFFATLPSRALAKVGASEACRS